MVNGKSENILILNQPQTWYVIDHITHTGEKLFLLENEVFGDLVPAIIVDVKGNVILEDVYNGFEDYFESLED